MTTQTKPSLTHFGRDQTAEEIAAAFEKMTGRKAPPEQVERLTKTLAAMRAHHAGK